MIFLNSKLNLFKIAVVATSLSLVPVLAFATPPVEYPDNMEMKTAQTAPTSGSFASSDLNNDGRLNLSEFTLYAGERAVSGDKDYTAVVAAGDYERAFKLLDVDTSGNLSEAEVANQKDGIDSYDMTPVGDKDMKIE